VLKEFSHAAPRPLPVIIMADCSGSMNEVIGGTFRRTGQTFVEDGRTWEAVEGGTTKRDALNRSIRDMLGDFRDASELRAQIHVSVVAFGGKAATVHFSLQPAAGIDWEDMACAGDTPMGDAFRVAGAMLEDADLIPSRGYRPTLVLVTDGEPTDRWEEPLDALLAGARSGKADRLALGIGPQADKGVLTQFLGNAGKPILHADDARKIRGFFRFVTMSVTARSRSANPNVVPPLEDPIALDQF
jgi:uncharacterized protein YegL